MLFGIMTGVENLAKRGYKLVEWQEGVSWKIREPCPKNKDDFAQKGRQPCPKN